MSKKQINKKKSKQKKVTRSASESGSSLVEGVFQSKLKELVKALKRHDLEEIEWSENGSSLRLKARSKKSRADLSPMMDHDFAERPLRQAPEEISEENGTLGLPENHQVITSPFVGTFYSAPSPGAEAYVTLGKTVQSGDVVCIVEAMKLMNQIEVECPGKIIKQHVQNGQPVEFGEPLFTLEV
jgi:acetyl-CoA carboxylase biotin carboxyl carrier protein